MTGISQIKKLYNMGVFESFLWPSASLTFKKTNILYGQNGSGKTTLSNIIRSFSDEVSDEERGEFVRDLKTDLRKEQGIEIVWNEKVLSSFTGGQKVFVFNSNFVSEHVYDGTKANIKAFKDSVITNEQLSNPTIKKITTKIDENTKKAEAVESVILTLQKEAKSIRSDLSERWNVAIKGPRLPQKLDLENAPEKAPLETLDSLEKELENCFQKFKMNENQIELTEDISTLESLKFNTVQLQNNFEELLKVQVRDIGGSFISEKIAALKDAHLRHCAGIKDWFEDGVSILKVTNDGRCPLCNNSALNVASLLDEYKIFFSDELTRHTEKLRDSVKELEKQRIQIEVQQKNKEVLLKLMQKYGAQNLASQTEQDIMKNAENTNNYCKSIEALSKLLKERQSRIQDEVKTSDLSVVECAAGEASKYNAEMETTQKFLQKIVQHLKGSSFDEKLSKEICKKLFWKSFDVKATKTAQQSAEKLEGDSLRAVTSGIALYHTLKEMNAKITVEVKEAEVTRRKELAKLKKESKYINEFLHGLCVSNFSVKLGEEDKDIEIIYKNGNRKIGMKNSISDGEKTAIAFAYFLSKYKHEVEQNTNENEGDYVVVIDDPISSLDENRLLSTALLIKGMFVNRSKQLFVFSHNLNFLKFFGNVLDKRSQENRGDFYLEEGKLDKLPKAISNFQTSYFYKLSKIQAFVKLEAPYESVKDSLPNNIRIVLETFLSFKFARLRENNGSRSPGLSQLTSHLDGYNFNSFAPINEINCKEKLSSTLHEIRQKVDPECHGTPQDLTDFEFMPESELRRIAQQALDIIAYLDQMHLTAVEKTASAAA